jgi:hypothetical protein
LGVEPVFEVIHPHCPKFWPSEIEEFVASGGTFAFEKRHLIESVEMVFVGLIAELHALKKLLRDARISCHSD